MTSLSKILYSYESGHGWQSQYLVDAIISSKKKKSIAYYGNHLSE